MFTCLMNVIRPMRYLLEFFAVLQVVQELSMKERSALMKFATSISRAPLGGFKHLNPPLTVHKVGCL